MTPLRGFFHRSPLVLWLGVALLLALYWVMAVSVSPRMGVTGDEVVHITGGYSYWKQNDYRLHPENGNLSQRIAALPLLALDLKFPSLDNADWTHSRVNQVGEKFFFQLGNPVERMLLYSRMMIALAGVFTAWLVWKWARHLFGRKAGWLALGLAVFCPALLAHGGLATSDMVMTACVLGALSAVWLLLHRATWGRLGLAALACGLTFLAKMSGIIIVPVIVALIVIRATGRTPIVMALGRARWIRNRTAKLMTATGLTAAVAAGSLLVVWAGFGFRYSGFNPAGTSTADYYFSWDVVLGQEPLPNMEMRAIDRLIPARLAPVYAPTDRVIEWIRDNRLLPEAYLWGMAQTSMFSRYRPAFLMGEYRTQGWVGFFPLAFLFKTPAGGLLLILAGAGALLGVQRNETGRRFRPWAYRMAPLLIFFGLYWAMALGMSLNIGHRHILPTYPVFYILAAASVRWLSTRNHRAATWVLVAALVSHAGESLMARPFYLSYFQTAAGGSEHGYRYLVDSSLDWGQGLPDLEHWLQRKRSEGDDSRVYLSYFGADSPRARHLEVIRFGDELTDTGSRIYPANLRSGWYVISATNFQRVYAPTRGPWTPRHEALYQSLMERLRSPAALNPQTPAAQQTVLNDCMDFELMQAARLFHFFNNRQPMEIIGGSLLVFHLTEAEVARALYGQPPP